MIVIIKLIVSGTTMCIGATKSQESLECSETEVIENFQHLCMKDVLIDCP